MRTLGKICGAIGLMLLLSAPFTYFATSGEAWVAGAKAVLGLALVGLFFATNYKDLGQFASGKATFFFISSAMVALVSLVALSGVNYIAAKKNKSWDLTNKKIYTLAPQTSSTLKGLKEKVRAIGFIAANHPYYEALDQLLLRYKHEAPDTFDYSFKDPAKNPDLAAKYQLKEGQTTVVLTRGEGAQESHTALGVVSEQELTNALIKLGSVGEQKVYFVSGHGEWPLEAPPAATVDMASASLSELKKDLLQEGYTPEALTLVGKTEVPRDAALVVVAGAHTPLIEQEVTALRKYLQEGGRLLYFAEAQLDPGPGIGKLLEEHGIQIDPGIVADDRYAVSSPYEVVSLFFGEHEMTRVLKQMQMSVTFPTPRGLTVIREGLAVGIKAEPVLTTSPYAWEESTPTSEPSRSSGEKTGQIPLVAASTRVTAADPHKRYDEARVVVFGDSELIADPNWGHEANRNLVMNAFGWASNQVAKITIRPPDRDISSLDIDKPTLARVRFIATDLVPLSLLGVGLAIWLTRRNK